MALGLRCGARGLALMSEEGGGARTVGAWVCGRALRCSMVVEDTGMR
jgi:hypothetical protein